MKTVKEVLESLGDSAGEVAAILRAKGIRGAVGSSCRCPLSIHLSAEVGQQVRITATDARICTNEGSFTITPFARAANGRALFAFVCAFDSRDYPELISGEAGDVYGS